MHLGLVNLYLRVGRSSGFRLLREVQAGEPHISGQDVKLVFCHRRYLPCGISKLVLICFVFSAAFKLCIRNVTLACKTLL